MKHLTRARQMRKRFLLTQAELAYLLDIHQANISRIESGEAHPDLATAYGLQLTFGLSLHDLFPALIEQIEDRVMRRAAELSARPSFSTAEKRRLLEGMAIRAHAQHHDL